MYAKYCRQRDMGYVKFSKKIFHFVHFSLEILILSVCLDRSSGKTEFPAEVINALYFLMSFCDISGLPLSTLTKHIPEAILNLFPLFAPAS